MKPLLRLCLLSCVFAWLQIHVAGQDAATDKPLKLEQVEQLLTIGWDDAVLAREMLKRGIAFRADAKTLERLTKKKLGAETRAALTQLETRAAFQEAQNTKEPNAQLNLGRQFLQQYATSEFAARAKELARTAELEIFDTAYQAYLAAPDLPKLNALFTRSDELRVREPDAATALHLAVRLARATGHGIYDNFYTDLERSRTLANEALRQLDQAPGKANDEATQKLRAENAPALAQLLALYHLRQTPANTTAALKLLERALAPDAATAKDPVTYWLRALINREQYQKLRTEYAALSPEARTSATIICQQFTALTNHLIEDYTKVVELGGAANVRSLRDEAVAAVKTLSQTPSPCAVPITPPAQRARRVATAQRTLFIRSKTVYLRAQQLETALLKDADFQSLNWRIVRNEKDADVIAEVTLPFLTWQWTIEVTQPASSALVGTVQIRETVARNALPKLLPPLVGVFKQVR